jgi:HK97 family phage prohead protease
MSEKREIKSIAFEIKNFDEEKGVFEGYGSIFGNKDSYNDIVHKGAFIKTLEKRKPAMLWQHKTDEPIGTWEEVREDEKGLFVKGSLEIESDFGKRVYGLLKKGALSGLSIGYSIPKGGSDIDKENKVRNLREVKLFEVSLVTMPANEESLIDTVKSIEQFTCMKDCEAFLMEKGLNRNERNTLISKLKEFSKKREVEDEKAKKREVEAKLTSSVEELLNKFIKQIKEN